MFTVISTFSRVDGSEILEYLSEIRHFATPIQQFRSQQPGFLNFTHEMSDDFTQFIGTATWESEAAYQTAEQAGLQNEEVSAGKNALEDFIARYQILSSKEYVTN
jgi:hypothetical protein